MLRTVPVTRGFAPERGWGSGSAYPSSPNNRSGWHPLLVFGTSASMMVSGRARRASSPATIQERPVRVHFLPARSLNSGWPQAGHPAELRDSHLFHIFHPYYYLSYIFPTIRPSFTPFGVLLSTPQTTGGGERLNPHGPEPPPRRCEQASDKAAELDAKTPKAKATKTRRGGRRTRSG